MKKLMLIFFIFFIRAWAGAETTVLEYEPTLVKIDSIKKFFSDEKRPGTGEKESDYASAKIVESLKISFDSTWKTFESRKGFIKDPIIREAVEALRIKIKNNKKYISLNFFFDENYKAYYKEKFTVKNDTGKTKGTLTYEQMIKNKDVVGKCRIIDDKYPKGAMISILNSFEDFQSMNMEYYDKSKGCTYEGLKYYITNGSPGKEKEPPDGWKWTTNKTYSFQATLFHEIVHVALEDAGLDRWGDDATVEDITLQIFPREPNNNENTYGGNNYEMLYDKALVDGGFQLNLIYSILKYWVIELFPLLITDEYYYNRTDRKFNPREKFNGIELRYQESDKIGVIEYLFRKDRKDITCNDAVSDALLKYVIPYAKCCNKEKCDPEPVRKQEELMNDRGDDNESSSSGVMKIANLDPEAVIFTAGHFREAFGLLGGLLFDGNNTAEELIKITKFLVLPSGSLTGNENPLFKNLLTEYVERGGTLVVFAQPLGSLFSSILPIPENGVLGAFGWREDQSCYVHSAYAASLNPVVSSCGCAGTWGNTFNIGTDGYFNPSDLISQIFLKRAKNGYPLMLYYPYPNNQGAAVGGAAVCSLFSDSASRFGQLSVSEKALVRDLLTFSRCPSKTIPMVKMSTEPVNITLSPNLVNKTQTPAVKALLKVVNPNRDKIFHQWETSVSLMPGEEKELSMSFQLPAFYSYQDTGICNLLYSIFDAEGNLLVMDAESDGGRFAVYRDIPEYVPPGDYQAWITSPGEIFDVNEIVPLTIYYKNNRENPLTIYQWWQWGHSGGESLPSLSLAPGEEKQYTIDVTFPQYMSNYKEIRAFFHLRHKLNTETSHRYTQKGFLVKGIRTESRLHFNSSRQLTPGGPFNYSIQSKFVSTPLPGNSTIKLALEKYSSVSHQYEEIKILKEEAYDFNANGDFQFAGTYTPETVHPYGSYRLKLAVTAPNGIKEQERYQEFIYDRSGFLVNLAKMPQSRLVPGESYTIPIKITNFDSINHYTVKNGTYVLVLRSENNHEVFRKEITGIAIAAEEELNHQETFVFNPVETGQYTLEYNYTDETGGDDVYHREAQTFFYITGVGVTADKAVYEYMDTANIGVTIDGVGSYTVQLSCPGAGFSGTRTVAIPTGSPGTIEQFQFPIGVYSIYTVNAEVKDVSNRSFNNIARLSVNPIELDCAGQFKDNIARAGKALEFEVNMKRISGFSQPLVGELAVTSSQLNYQDIKTVTLQPVGDNRFLYTIPVDPEAPVGFYGGRQLGQVKYT
jgi:hypothetical protein